MITFRSTTAADISMFDGPARELLRMAGRLDADRGAIGADEVASALQTLRQALANLPAAEPAEPAAPDEDGEPAEPAVSLNNRAYPLIEMLERAAAKDVAVLWDHS